MVRAPSTSARCSIYAAIGLMLVFVWSSLSDHMFGLHEALPQSLSINPRAFFLLGILALCIAFSAMPSRLRAKNAILEILLPFVGSVGTACIAIASSQSLFPASALCVVGLIAVGVGYCWFVVRYGLLLASTPQSVSRIVYCLAAALIMEPLVRVTLESSFNQTVRVCIAVMMPLISIALLHRVRQITSKESEQASTPSPISASVGQETIRKRFILLFSTALLLATVRTISPVGTWDAPFDPVPMTSSIELVCLYAACVALFAHFALVNMEGKSTFAQFQPAFLVIVLTLLVSLILPYAQGPQSAVLYTFMCLDDSFAHMLFWASIAHMVGRMPMPPYRIAGLAAGVYAIGSIVWLVIIGNSEMPQTLTIIVAIATLYILTLITSTTNDIQRDTRLEHEQTPSIESAEANDTAILADRISASIEERCLELSREFGLSPRETEVMTLLAQGRTRLYIQEKLVLAENTVKTHIAHIYRKLGVSNRQDLLDLVFGKKK